MKTAALSPSIKDIAADIRVIGFSCQRCGLCCRECPDDSGLVYASSDEVEALVSSGAGTWEEVAEPYPDFTPCGTGSAITFGWCIRHVGGRCRFLSNGGCTVYQARPRICRTYPFALIDGNLVISDCPGLGGSISEADASALASDLLERAWFEREEEERVRGIFPTIRIPEGKRCVVDGSGLRVCDEGCSGRSGIGAYRAKLK